MDSVDIQQLFFQKIKESMPVHLSFVDDVAELLNISNDSVYRRIRGDKVISLDEVQKFCSHYMISLDQFFNLKSDAYIFKGELGDNSEQSFDAWLKRVTEAFLLFNNFEKRHLTILMKDIPPFVHFQIPELALFKFYFWMKSILHYESLKNVKFDLEDEFLQSYLPASKKIINLYHSMPITEIWNVESLNSSLRQVKFYHESGLLKNSATTKMLLDKLELLINHIESEAELGLKFDLAKQADASCSEYRIFVNELILGDNTYLAELDGQRMVFLNHSVLYFIATTDEKFTSSTAENMLNLERKSTLISGVGEKERTVFFNKLRNKIQYHQKQL
jgi:hypothetical protein